MQQIRVLTYIKQGFGSRLKFKLLTTLHQEKMLLKTRVTFYEFGDKASKLLLTYQAHQSDVSTMNTQFQSSSGTMLHTAQDMNNRFVQYQLCIPQNILMIYLSLNPYLKSYICLLSVLVLNLGFLLGNRRLRKLLWLCRVLKPGPEGFPIEFYKKFSDLLSPLLVVVYNEAFERGYFHLTLTQASISILKRK